MKKPRSSKAPVRRPLSTPKSDSSDKTPLQSAFERLWSDLFSGAGHLDSLLSKQTKSQKSILAQVVPMILMKPVSAAQSLGIGMKEGEPWSLSTPALAKWRSAAQIAQRIHAGMAGGLPKISAAREDFPPRMIEEWVSDWGEDRARSLIEVLGGEAPLSLRATRRLGAESVIRELKGGEGRLPVSVSASDFAPYGVRLGGYAPVMHLPVYEQGGYEIQDEGSQMMALFALWPDLVAPLLQDAPGPVKVPADFRRKLLDSIPGNPPALNIVDACAGAGGKSLAFADLIGGKGRIFSYDTSLKKLQALKRRATRAGFNNIQTVAVEEENEKAAIGKFRARADIVLVDAPCTGWGVLRRNPDIKWRQDADVLERMPVLQGRLLSTYSDLVAPGGRLVFGLCTFRKSESRDVVESFLRQHPDFTAGPGGYLGPGPCDGFFMQAFTRKKKGRE